MRNQVIRDRALLNDKTISLRLEQPTNNRIVAALVMRTQNHDEALPLLLEEAQRLKHFGVDKTEFNALKAEAYSILQRQLKNGADNRDYNAWEDKITNAVIAGKVLQNSREKARQQILLLNSITLEQLNDRLKELLNAPDQFLYYQIPDGIEVPLPTATTVRQLQANAGNALKPTVAYQVSIAEQEQQAEPITLPPITLYPEGEIRRFNRIPATRDAAAISQWSLDNGDSIVWLEQPTADNKLYINVVTDTGFDNLTQSPMLSQIAVQLWQQTPPTGWSESQWKLMPQWSWVYKSQQLSLGAVITPAQLPKLLDTYRIQLQEGHIAAEGLPSVKSDLLRHLSSANKNHISEAMAQLKYHSQIHVLDDSTVADIEVPMLETLAKEVLTQPVTFYVVGALPQEVDELWTQKVASLPRKKTLVAAPLMQQSGHHLKELALYDSPKMQVMFEGYTQLEWSPEQAFLVSSLAELTQSALKQRLRLELAGTYSIRFDLTLNPATNHAEMALSFFCAPERRNELLTAAQQVLQNMPLWLKKQDLTPLISNIHYAEQQRLALGATWLKRLELSDHRYGNGHYLEHVRSLPSLVTHQSLATLAEHIFPLQNSATVIAKPKGEND